MLKLRLIQGKTLIFVNSVNQGFKLHLFLQALFIPSAVLNSELPENSRNFVLEEFDQGKYNVLIASDESHLFQNEVLEAIPDAITGKRQKSLEQREYGVSRGFDFKNVANVLNFDFPEAPEAYVHRIGRTARAGARGKALSFICSSQEEMVLEMAAELQKKDGTKIAPFGFKMQAVEGLSYRVEDVLSSITKNQVKEARAGQVKAEILRSSALKNHFEDHPRDLEALSASQNGTKRRKLPELKKIPDYLRPTAQDSVQIKRALGGNAGALGKDQKKKKSGWNKKKKKKANDPLKSFKVRGR
jgi:ATP-dependent RNA helicase DDX56/DBP9